MEFGVFGLFCIHIEKDTAFFIQWGHTTWAKWNQYFCLCLKNKTAWTNQSTAFFIWCSSKANAPIPVTNQQWTVPLAPPTGYDFEQEPKPHPAGEPSVFFFNSHIPRSEVRSCRLYEHALWFFPLTEQHCALRNCHLTTNGALQKCLIHRRAVRPQIELIQQKRKAQNPEAIINNANDRHRDLPHLALPNTH